jgi:hypothetical protein
MPPVIAAKAGSWLPRDQPKGIAAVRGNDAAAERQGKRFSVVSSKYSA